MLWRIFWLAVTTIYIKAYFDISDLHHILTWPYRRVHTNSEVKLRTCVLQAGKKYVMILLMLRIIPTLSFLSSRTWKVCHFEKMSLIIMVYFLSTLLRETSFNWVLPLKKRYGKNKNKSKLLEDDNKEFFFTTDASVEAFEAVLFMTHWPQCYN